MVETMLHNPLHFIDLITSWGCVFGRKKDGRNRCC